jgi:tetratricopeptide (TPR) repeat protein
VLLTYRRDELRHNHPLLPHIRGWARSGLATSIELEPLTAEDVAGIVSAIFDRGAVTADFRDYLEARTEGNPFVLEEMLKGALDRGEIYRTDVGWERKALAELRIPPTISEVILQRLARLDSPQRDVVRTAAVLGESFTYDALVATSGATEQLVRAALRECVQHQLMEAESDQRFRFRHALTRQAIYEDLLGPERAARHFQAAAALRIVSGTPSAETATHLVLAGQWDQAVPELMRAAEDAASRRGYHEAADLYERALPHVADRLLQSRLWCRQADAYYLAGEPTRAQPLLERGIPILEQAGHGNEAASHRLTLGSCHFLAGQFDQAKADYEGIRANLEARGPNETLAVAYVQLALLALNDHFVEEGLKMADAAIRTAEAIGADRPRIWSHIYRGVALAESGSVEAGLHDLDRSWQEAIERELFDVAGIALSNAIYHRCLSFRASRTGPLFDRLKTLPDLVHAGGRLATWICLRRAFTDVVLGDMPGARAAAVEGLRLAHQSAAMLIPEFTSFAAVAECALGRPNEARIRVPQLFLPLTQQQAETAWGAMRVSLDLGEIRRARELATEVITYLHQISKPILLDLWLIDKAVEVFLAAKMPEQAEQLRLKAEAAPSVGQPLRDRIEGRVALFHGDLIRADEGLTAAALLFQDYSYRDDEWRTRRALAEVKIRRGERVAAEHELRLVIAGADAHGHVFEAAAARRQLQDLESSLTLTKPRGRH